MYSICQRCAGPRSDHWNVKQSEFHVGAIQHWKVQLCDSCTAAVEQAVLAALRPTSTAFPTQAEGERG